MDGRSKTLLDIRKRSKIRRRHSTQLVAYQMKSFLDTEALQHA